MYHWMLVAPQALNTVLPVADSFSNMEMRTFSRIRAHRSTSEAYNTSLWRRKTKPASVNCFAVVVLATNKICGTFLWQISVFSGLWNQGRNDVRWRPGQKTNSAPPWLKFAPQWANLSSFEGKYLLYWRKYLWHCWDFSAPPAVIWRPCSDSAPP